MPGISIVRKIDESFSSDKFKGILDKNMPYYYFESVVAFESDDIIIGYDTHSSYPIISFEFEDFVVIFEGRIYNIPEKDVKTIIQGLLPSFFEGSQGSEEKLAKWLRSVDGDFLVVAYDKKKHKLAILNDIFRRLPYYFHKDNGNIVISRNLKFVTDCLPEFRFDKLGLAQYLVFHYQLGDRTSIESVKRSSVAMLLTADFATGECTSKSLYEFDFSLKKNAGKSVKENADKLEELFSQGVKNRVGNKKNIISQSGGMDSRSVAAALANTGADVEATTWKDAFDVSELDTATAKRISKTLSMPWNCFELENSNGSNMLDLLKITRATIKLLMPHSMQYMGKLRDKFGPDMIYFSGNGGDRIMRCIVPHTQYMKNIESLIEYILNYDGPDLTRFGLDNALKLTGVSKEEFMNSLKDLLDSYPEKSPADKFVHYNIFGQSLNCHHCGDDKNRSFFWNTSPFWSTDFMFYSMNCTDSQKRYMYLYTNFLSQLNGELLDIPYANNRQKTPILIKDNKSSIRYFLKVLNSKPNPIRFLFKKIKGFGSSQIKFQPPKHQHAPAIMDCLNRQRTTCEAVKQYLSTKELDCIIEESYKYKKDTFASLFTVTTLLEYYSTGSSSVENYKDQSFDCYG